MNKSSWILIVIVISQFCCTSLWFAGNGVMQDLVDSFQLNASALGHLTSAVQFGFIGGTLIFALLAISDRYSPSKVFFICGVLAAAFNTGVIWHGHGLFTLLALRFLTGFFLAGIYPVGMKIAADYFDQGLGKSLGFLVGALVIGTAFPHLLKSLGETLSWTYVLLATSSLSVGGGLLMMVLVADGPFRKPGPQLKPSALVGVFSNHKFRSAAIGYFGHMWELYAFWAFVPLMLKTYADLHSPTQFNVALLSFVIIAMGGPACVLAGYVSKGVGVKRTAAIALSASGFCCLVSPFIFETNSEVLFIGFLLFWGIMVVADSPLFSTLVAQNTIPEIKGSVLTIVNCIGFSVTIVSIQLITAIQSHVIPSGLFVILAIGPMGGLLALRRD
ncbi:MAG: MFS transporter [Reichenbachiella sp.]|uniref:MFS transporter n=1 Tax=Reichenbachiella sp. TaxID=2184521 RepID=UPI003265F574